jgi:hypothetical protein
MTAPQPQRSGARAAQRRDEFGVQTRRKALEDRIGAQPHAERELLHAGFDPPALRAARRALACAAACRPYTHT